MKADRDLLLVSVFTFFTVSLWIFFELVKTTKTSTVVPTVQNVIAPLPKSLDTAVLTSLAARKHY
ncbi:hypothetical protein M1555_03370 [Patescibacteria group bacterium]|nr:hypothetical protein [Patescibacteria group bacterium]